MTRFARAKGSKSSNERLPEEATSWTEMKKQLLTKSKEIEESQKRKEVIDQRNANYRAFLEKNEEDKIKNSKWADFPEVSKQLQRKKKTKSVRKDSVEKGSNKSFDSIKVQDNSEDEEFTLLKNKVDNILDNINKEEAVIVTNDQNDSDSPPEEESAKKEIVEPVIKVKKQKKRKLLKIVVDQENINRTESNPIESGRNKKKRRVPESGENTENKKRKLTNVSEDPEGVIKNKNTKRKKNKNGADETKPEKKIVKKDLTEKDLRKIEKKKLKRIKQVEKKKRVKAELKMQKNTEISNKQEQVEVGSNVGETENKLQPNILNKIDKNHAVSKEQVDKSIKPNKDKKKTKINNEEKPQRRKPFLPHKMVIHDKEVEIDYVEGFPIKKEDAVRLKKLRKEMISKGLPRSEINVALKLERRRAEKALANLKKKACYHCRKSGHNLSECPELGKDQVAQTAGSGICFKCGSTEHTHYECKVVRGQEFKFAQCFICNEQGHISRQCPDNARGLYPKGGACHVCGDVTHLKRDCPKYQAQQQRQEDGLKIETFGSSNPDVLEESGGNIGGILNNKKPNKIIKF